LAINSSIVNVFFAIFLAVSKSSDKRRYSSLKVRIAEGSIPTNGISLLIKSLKSAIFLFAKFLASLRKPFEI